MEKLYRPGFLGVFRILVISKFECWRNKYISYHIHLPVRKELSAVLFMTVIVYGCNSQTQSDQAKESLQEGLVAADNHNWEKALEHFQKSVDLDSLSASAWANHGTALLNTGMPGKAIISYNRSKALNDEDPYIFCSLSSACNRLKKYEEAIHHAEKALEIDSFYAPAMANKAWSLKQLGLTEKSDSLFKKAFELKPELRKHFRKEYKKTE